jgi:hypothetical protein
MATEKELQDAIYATITATADATARIYERQLEAQQKAVETFLAAIGAAMSTLIPVIVDQHEKDRASSLEREKMRTDCEKELRGIDLKMQEEKTRTAEAAAGKFNK